VRRLLLLFIVLFGASCSVLPTPVPTADAHATETRIAGNIYATQTASAPTPDPRVTETAIAAKIFATQTASAPIVTPTSVGAQAANILCLFLTPQELPNYGENGPSPIIFANLNELETRKNDFHAPDTWRKLLQDAGMKSACHAFYIGMLPPEQPGKPLPGVATMTFVFGGADGARTFFENADLEPYNAVFQENPFHAVGDESKQFYAQNQDERVSYYLLFRKKNVVALIGIEGPVKSTVEGELIRIAKIVETKIP
jgi:hypothetical protein